MKHMAKPNPDNFQTTREFALASFEQYAKTYEQGHLSRRHWEEYNHVRVFFLGCMDGRHDFERVCKLPTGTVRTYGMRGAFNLGSPWFGHLLVSDVERDVVKHGYALVIESFHFSKCNNAGLGCKAYGHDLTAAREGINLQLAQSRFVWQQEARVLVVAWGYDTDKGDIYMVSEDGSKGTYVSELGIEPSEASVRALLKQYYPSATEKHVKEMAYLILRNSEYIRELKDGVQTVDHTERIVIFGRGALGVFDINTAFRVGPFSDDLFAPLGTAMGIIKQNLEAGRIPSDREILLITAALCEDPHNGPHVRQCQLKAGHFKHAGLEYLFGAPGATKLNELQESLQTLKGKVDVLAGYFEPDMKFIEVCDEDLPNAHLLPKWPLPKVANGKRPDC